MPTLGHWRRGRRRASFNGRRYRRCRRRLRARCPSKWRAISRCPFTFNTSKWGKGVGIEEAAPQYHDAQPERARAAGCKPMPCRVMARMSRELSGIFGNSRDKGRMHQLRVKILGDIDKLPACHYAADADDARRQRSVPAVEHVSQSPGRRWARADRASAFGPLGAQAVGSHGRCRWPASGVFGRKSLHYYLDADFTSRTGRCFLFMRIVLFIWLPAYHASLILGAPRPYGACASITRRFYDDITAPAPRGARRFSPPGA